MTEAEARAALDGKVLRGKDDWLFLDNDVNQVLKQHTGELRFSDRDLEDWRLLLETRNAWLAKRGIPYFFLVAPNAHSVYPEKLPDEVKPVAKRPIEQLLSHLSDKRSSARIMYPLERLVEKKKQRLVYSQTDSHWNFLGSFIAYDFLMDEVERLVAVRRLDEEEIVWDEATFVGGLGYKVEPHQESVHVYAKHMPKQALLVSDNCVLNHGSLMEFRCDAAPDTTCLFLGDSFAVNPLLFLAESFRQLVYAHTTLLDFELVEEREPDVVISLVNERFLMKIPYDLPARTVRQMAEEKRAKDIVRSRLAWWESAPEGS
jgi:hypothetical protein